MTVVACVVLVQGPLEQRNEFGIMFRHAYSVTAVEKVTVALIACISYGT